MKPEELCQQYLVQSFINHAPYSYEPCGKPPDDPIHDMESFRLEPMSVVHPFIEWNGGNRRVRSNAPASAAEPQAICHCGEPREHLHDDGPPADVRKLAERIVDTLIADELRPSRRLFEDRVERMIRADIDALLVEIDRLMDALELGELELSSAENELQYGER